VKKTLLLLFFAGLLTACGKSAPVRVPNPLQPFKAELKPEVLWRAQVGEGVGKRYLRLQPAVLGSHLYIADFDGKLMSLDRNTGDTIWQVELPIKVSSGVGIGGSRLFLASPDGEVVAVSADDGHVLWQSLVSSEVFAPPVDAGDKLLVHTTDGKLFALDAATGRVLWTYDRSVPVLNLRGTSTPVVSQGVVFDSFASGKIAVLQLDSGKVLLEQPLAIPKGRSDLERMIDADAGPLLGSGGVVYVATYQGRILAVNLRNGRQLWERKASIYQAMTMDQRYLYAADADDAVTAYDKNNGLPAWSQDKLYARDITAPALMGDYLLVGDFEGYLHVLDKHDGHFVARFGEPFNPIKRDHKGGMMRRLTRNHLGLLTRPLVVDGVVYLYNRSGLLTALKLTPKAR
jgi:outer membrane protein assembly factor BamB